MDLTAHSDLLSAIVTILAILLYFYMGMRVGAARTKYNVPAPAMTGNPVVERTIRVHYNTLEAMPIFLPLLWLATIYFTKWGWLPAAVGVVWIIGRYIYMEGYIADAAKRSNGFLIQMLAQLVLLILAGAGIAMTWMG